MSIPSFSDITGSISEGAAAAKEKVNITAERGAINAAFFGLAPDWLVSNIQNDFRAWGIPLPDSLSAGGVGQLGAVTIGIGIILAVIISVVIGAFNWLFKKYFFLCVSLIMVGVGLYLFYSNNKSPLRQLLKSVSTISAFVLVIHVIWIIVYLIYMKHVDIFTSKNPKHPNNTIAYATYISIPIAEIFIKDKSHYKGEEGSDEYIIGPRSKGMFRLGWTALTFLLVSYFVVQRAPELEGFINNLKEGFKGKKEDDEDIEESFADKTAVAESPDNAEQITLVNIQPVSIKQIGYNGPKEDGGTFETDSAIINAVRAGVRFFILQIDYLEKVPGPGFDPINTPTLLYRNDSGNVISKNGASIEDVAKQLSTYAFNKDFPSYTQPLILYLHFVRMPNFISKPDKYTQFMKDVAKSLAPIQSLILNKHESTDFSRQKNERVLLYSPLANFEGKILLWTNADTSVFRNLERLSMAPVSINEDLDYMSCMRVYLDNSKDSFGATTVASDTPAYAVIVPFKRFAKMKDKKSEPNKEKQDFAIKGKSRFVIAMPGQTDNIKMKDVEKLLSTAGVNTVPMNLFGKSDPEIRDQIAIWNGNPFYRMKPALLQSSKAAVAGYTPPPNILK